MLRFLFFRNYMDFHNPLTAYFIFIHFNCQRYSRTFISSQQEIHPQLLSSLTRYNRYRRLCHGLCFQIRVLIRETFAILEVALSTTIIFFQYSHNVRLFYLFVIFQTRNNLLFCIPTVMIRMLSVLDFIFMMILFMRFLTFFMRCSLHENRGVLFYFYPTSTH